MGFPVQHSSQPSPWGRGGRLSLRQGAATGEEGPAQRHFLWRRATSWFPVGPTENKLEGKQQPFGFAQRGFKPPPAADEK